MTKAFEVEFKGPVALVRLERRPVNALDEAALGDLGEALGLIQGREEVRAALFYSGVEGIFCTGGDMKYWPKAYPDRADKVGRAGREVFARLERLPVPTIAAIQGKVIGDGLSLALACDLCLASEDSSFCLPEVGYGFIPGWGTIGRVRQAAGRARAAELLFLGRPVDARQAREMGLVNQVKEKAGLMPSALALTEILAGQPRLAMVQVKAALRGGRAGGEEDTAWEERCFAAVWGKAEWAEGVKRAFNP